MKYNDACQYIKNLKLNFPQVTTIDSIGAYLERITFPHGCILFSNSKNIDQMFIFHDNGFPYAVSILAYYFGSDIPNLEPEFVRPYQAIIVDNVRYIELSPMFLDRLAVVKSAFLERDEITKEDPRLTSISFNDYSLISDMVINQGSKCVFKDF